MTAEDVEELVEDGGRLDADEGEQAEAPSPEAAEAPSAESVDGLAAEAEGELTSEAEDDSAETEGELSEAEDASSEDAGARTPADPEPEPEKRPRRKLVIALVVVAVLVVLGCAFGIYGYATGSLAPAGAAAKYGTFDYLDESDVTEYVMTYKTQMGYGSASDDSWAAFLASYNLTPDRLRMSAVNELLSVKAIEKRAAELGITVTDAEVDATVEAFKDAYAFDDDTIFENTLAAYGQTLEGFRETERQALLKEKLLQADLTVSDPTEDEIRDTVKTYAAYYESYDKENTADISQVPDGHTIKHSYCFSIKLEGGEPSLADSEKVDSYKKAFQEGDMTVEAFVSLVSEYCDVDEVKDAGGDMGWGADLAEYSETYANILEKTEVGGLSPSFSDDGAECFIWVDRAYVVPYDEAALDSLDLTAMPEGLYNYFSDYALYINRSNLSSSYVADLVAKFDIILYPMPSDVPYNVDMSAYYVSESTDGQEG